MDWRALLMRIRCNSARRVECGGGAAANRAWVALVRSHRRADEVVVSRIPQNGKSTWDLGRRSRKFHGNFSELSWMLEEMPLGVKIIFSFLFVGLAIIELHTN